jgi:putative phosphoribosyl transferase
MSVSRSGLHKEVLIPAQKVTIFGHLDIPEHARGVIIFAHGSGSGRHSPRNQFVAAKLNNAGLGTLLIDLLTESESEDRENVFDIPLLARRLATAAHWVIQQPETALLNIGYFGASTGAGAALVAAADHPELIKAIVSRGGRPDLAENALPRVQAPTLLIVGGLDQEVISLNRQAMNAMTAECDLMIVPGATHLFPEPGTLEEVARLATDWFLMRL